MNRKDQLSDGFEILYDLTVTHDYKFEPIKTYINNVPILITKIENKLFKKIKNWDKKNKFNYKVPLGHDIYELEIQTTSELRKIFQSSILNTIYSIFENELVEICKYSGGLINSSLTPKDLSGNNYIEQCKTYIIKILEINIDNLQDELGEIKQIQLIRNSFTHNNGILKNPNPSIIQYIKQSENIEINETTFQINIQNENYLLTMINKLILFLWNIIDNIAKQKLNLK